MVSVYFKIVPEKPQRVTDAIEKFQVDLQLRLGLQVHVVDFL